MILMMVCAVGTEFDLHAYMVSKPPDENLQPSAAGFHPRANARRPQPDFWIEDKRQFLRHGWPFAFDATARSAPSRTGFDPVFIALLLCCLVEVAEDGQQRVE